MALRACDIMQRNVLSVPPDMLIPELVDFLISHRVSGVPVIEKGKVVGIVSRSDLVRAVSLERSLAGIVAQGFEQDEFAPGEAPPLPGLRSTAVQELQQRSVRAIMVTDPVSVAPDTPVVEVARLLVARHMHRVLVTDGAQLVGVISSLDVVRLVAEQIAG
ncbi:MAG TPA: CBS domain-containing protein [Candidatus Binatia bacterium]|jgi:CBS domain-containing protein